MSNTGSTHYPSSGRQNKLVVRDSEEWERLVFAEVLIPDVPNVYGDYHTRESVVEFAYGFMMNGFNIDVNHDNIVMDDTIKVVESFIAREGDPDFLPGSWVVGMKILDDAVWMGVLNGDINGYSYEAYVQMLEAELTVPAERQIAGITQDDNTVDHIHEFWVVMDEDGRPIMGGTSQAEDGHSHPISSHTVTDSANGHSHIYQIVDKEYEQNREIESED